MKITESQLRRIIREEIRSISESSVRDRIQRQPVGRQQAMDAARRRDDGWSGSSEVAARAGEEYDVDQAIGELGGMSSSELDSLERRAKDSLRWSGEHATPDAIINQMAHLRRR
jgi:hypothetical protein